MDLVHVDAWSRLIVANIAVNSSSVRIVVVYQVERISFFRHLGPFRVDSPSSVLKKSWNAVLAPKLESG